jgi:hypothetical protein
MADGDKDRFAAVAARGEQIKTSSAEYLWICKGIKPPMLPDKPIARDLRLLNGAAPGERRK